LIEASTLDKYYRLALLNFCIYVRIVLYVNIFSSFQLKYYLLIRSGHDDDDDDEDDGGDINKLIVNNLLELPG
jgi:hypothetical protein